MMAQNPNGPPPNNVHNNPQAQYIPQMQPTPTIGSTLSSNPSYQSSPNQNNGDNNANKKTPKEKTPMCQVCSNYRNAIIEIALHGILVIRILVILTPVITIQVSVIAVIGF